MVKARQVGKYHLGRTIGEGTFAKVKFANNAENGESVAIKILAKSNILKHKMVDQIKREISIMKIVRHPNIVSLHEVLASRTKIYIVLEFVAGGALFDEIVHQGRLSEEQCRRIFQQLIDAIAHCHSKGVYHRDLKPENLLLDSHGRLKVSDFGLSALHRESDVLLHTTCGTPNYLAPEVLAQQGYNGAAADVWSCGIILYILMAGYLPFEESDLPTLYKKINAAEFSCPFWFSPGATSLIRMILDPNPKTVSIFSSFQQSFPKNPSSSYKIMSGKGWHYPTQVTYLEHYPLGIYSVYSLIQRIRIDEIGRHPWFQSNYFPVQRLQEIEEVNLDDVQAVFDDIEEKYVAEKSESRDGGPLVMNAFEMITLSQGLNLSALFDRRQDYVKRQTRFVSRKPAKTIVSSIEAVAESMGLKVHTRNFKIRIEGLSANKAAAKFAVVLEVYEVAPSLFMIDARKAVGDTLEYHKFYKNFCLKLDNIIWKPTGANPGPT